MEKRITGRTGMFCLIGTPVGHSGSPAMYNYSRPVWTMLIWHTMCLWKKQRRQSMH